MKINTSAGTGLYACIGSLLKIKIENCHVDYLPSNTAVCVVFAECSPDLLARDEWNPTLEEGPVVTWPGDGTLGDLKLFSCGESE